MAKKRKKIAKKKQAPMTFEELKDFIAKTMRLSHIYQPLMIRALIDAGGSATLRQLAQSFVLQDESQLLFYQDRIRQMPLKVLEKRGVIKYSDGLVSLATQKLTLEQKATLRMICEQRLQEYVSKRGLSIWDYRLLDTEPVSDDLRYQVLRDSGRRCELCGATKKDRPLHIDHIIPRSRGGKTERANLQVLCSKCNCTKGNKDTTDYSEDAFPQSDPDCQFCPPHVESKITERNKTAVAIRDEYPVTTGHMLVVPTRHSKDFFSMTSQEREDALNLIRYLKSKTIEEDPSVVGFNVGTNCGIAAGQSVMHAHIHLIPRREGDTPRPKGGVRGVIPSKMAY